MRALKFFIQSPYYTLCCLLHYFAHSLVMLLIALLNAQHLIRIPLARYHALGVTQLILLNAGLDLALVYRPQHLCKPVLALAFALEIMQL